MSQALTQDTGSQVVLECWSVLKQGLRLGAGELRSNAKHESPNAKAREENMNRQQERERDGELEHVQARE